MDDLEYGFKAIQARCENYGFYDISFSELSNVNLDDYFADEAEITDASIVDNPEAAAVMPKPKDTDK